MRIIALVIWLAGLIPAMGFTDSLPLGTWVRRPDKDGTSATMTIEAAGAGRKLTFKFKVAGGGTSTMVVTTQGDGKDAAVSLDGKPSGETMAIRLVDDRHTTNLIKMNGNPMVNQKSELSADGKVIKVESTPMVPGGQGGIEYWDKQ
jgi:hypothetical protein